MSRFKARRRRPLGRKPDTPRPADDPLLMAQLHAWIAAHQDEIHGQPCSVCGAPDRSATSRMGRALGSKHHALIAGHKIIKTQGRKGKLYQVVAADISAAERGAERGAERAALLPNVPNVGRTCGAPRSAHLSTVKTGSHDPVPNVPNVGGHAEQVAETVKPPQVISRGYENRNKKNACSRATDGTFGTFGTSPVTAAELEEARAELGNPQTPEQWADAVEARRRGGGEP